MSALGLLERSQAAGTTIDKGNVSQMPLSSGVLLSNRHQRAVETITATGRPEVALRLKPSGPAATKRACRQQAQQKPSALRAIRLSSGNSSKLMMSSSLQASVLTQLGFTARLGEKRQLEWETEVVCCKAIQVAHVAQSSADTLQQRRQLMQQAAQAKALLVAGAKRFIMYQARQLQAGLNSTCWVPLEDMFLAGIDGLCAAALKYNAAAHNSGGSRQAHDVRRTRFLSFARHYIAKAMRATFRDWQSNDLYIPSHLIDIRAKVAAAVSDMKAEAKAHGRMPSIRAVAARTGLRPRAVRDAIHAMTLNLSALDEAGDEQDKWNSSTVGMRYLDQAGVMSEDPGTAGQGVPSSRLAVHSQAQVLVEQQVKLSSLQDVLSKVLNKRECLVMMQTMGLDEYDSATPTQVAAMLGVSRQRVEQIQMEAIQKLRIACHTQHSIACDLQEVCAAVDN